MNNQDELKIDILPDGTIRFETDEVSPANHANCEDFLKFIERMTGGKTTVKHKHGHVHEHEHQHIHLHTDK